MSAAKANEGTGPVAIADWVRGPMSSHSVRYPVKEAVRVVGEEWVVWLPELVHKSGGQKLPVSACDRRKRQEAAGVGTRRWEKTEVGKLISRFVRNLL